jgi:hypothetical protein
MSGGSIRGAVLPPSKLRRRGWDSHPLFALPSSSFLSVYGHNADSSSLPPPAPPPHPAPLRPARAAPLGAPRGRDRVGVGGGRRRVGVGRWGGGFFWLFSFFFWISSTGRGGEGRGVDCVLGRGMGGEMGVLRVVRVGRAGSFVYGVIAVGIGAMAPGTRSRARAVLATNACGGVRARCGFVYWGRWPASANVCREDARRPACGYVVVALSRRAFAGWCIGAYVGAGERNRGRRCGIAWWSLECDGAASPMRGNWEQGTAAPASVRIARGRRRRRGGSLGTPTPTAADGHRPFANSLFLCCHYFVSLLSHIVTTR